MVKIEVMLEGETFDEVQNTIEDFVDKHNFFGAVFTMPTKGADEKFHSKGTLNNGAQS